MGTLALRLILGFLVLISFPKNAFAQVCGGCGSWTNWILHGCGPQPHIACLCDPAGNWVNRTNCSNLGLTCLNGLCLAASPTPTPTPTRVCNPGTHPGSCAVYADTCCYGKKYVNLGCIPPIGCPPAPAPTSTPTFKSTPTPTRVPTSTPRPTSTSIPTATPIPTRTPTSTFTPTPTPTPTHTFTPTTTPSPTTTLFVFPTPSSTVAPAPSPTPYSTITTFPTATFTPTVPPSPVPSPTSTFTPTPTPTPTPILPAPPPSPDIFCPPIGSSPAIRTALGCIPVEFNSFMAWLLSNVFGIAGAISFLRIVQGFIGISTSKGNVEKLEISRDRIKAAILGLVVVVFSLFLLRLISVGILRLPGLN